MIERPDPDALMAGPLGEWLRSRNGERERVRIKARRWRNWGLGLAVVIVFLIIVPSGLGAVPTALFISSIFGVGGFLISELIKRPLLDQLKGGINGAIATSLGLDYSVSCTPGKTFERAKLFEMLPSYDNSSFQDLWWGTVGGQPFTLHEARLTEQRGSGKNRHTVTVFAGTILSIGFNRRFVSTTLLEPDGERRKFLIGAEKEKATIGDLEMERIDMVDPRFEQRFTVWSNDQVESRYLIHPEYVERLLAVEAAFSGDDIRALFHDGDLLITLKTGDLFESGSLDSGNDRALLEHTIAQFTSLEELATKLNERARATFRDPPPAS
jgi:hypothetical protein